MYPPVFMVSSVSEARRVSAASQYAPGAQAQERLWRVSMTHVTFAGEGLDLWFPSQAEADRFSPYQLFNQAELLKTAGNTTDKFIAQGVTKTKTQGATNAYSDLAQTVDAWKASLTNPVDGRGADWIYPSEPDAQKRFKNGHGYSLQDMIGTLPAVPTVVSQAYKDAADAAMQRDAEAKAAQEAAVEAEAEAKEKARLAAIAKKKADAAAKAKAAKAKALAAAKAKAAKEAAAAKAKSAAAYAAYIKKISTHTTTALYNPTHLAVITNLTTWSIVNGGAAGTYTDPAGEPRFYATGAFEHPANGNWYGGYHPA